MNARPIPVHCELKNPNRWKWGAGQLKEKARIERSGSIYLLCKTPEEFHQFFLAHGMNRIKMAAQPLPKKYTEHDLSKFVRGYLKLAEHMYGVYWAQNQQGALSKKGRPDWYFEIPDKTK